jgi:hypothetical protein
MSVVHSTTFGLGSCCFVGISITIIATVVLYCINDPEFKILVLRYGLEELECKV